MVTTGSPQAALELLRSGNVSALGTDYRMPEMGGIELLRIAQVIAPRTSRFLFTAFAGESQILWEHRAGLFTLFAKPWQDPELRRTILKEIRTRELEGRGPLRGDGCGQL